MKADDQINEHRRSTRRSAYMKGSIFHPLQTEHMDCIVLDISSDGALIDFLHSMDLPKIFWLRLEGDATLNLCTIAWRSEHQVGVEFSDQIMERRRVERWTNANWSRPRTKPQGEAPSIGVSNSVRWSASLVCLGTN
jgi:hypothetical protein